MKSLSELIDFTTPPEGGGGSKGVGGDRTFAHPSCFYGPLTLETSKYYLYDDRDGAFQRIVKGQDGLPARAGRRSDEEAV